MLSQRPNTDGPARHRLACPHPDAGREPPSPRASACLTRRATFVCHGFCSPPCPDSPPPCASASEPGVRPTRRGGWRPVSFGLRRWSHGARTHTESGTIAQRIDSGPERNGRRDCHGQRGGLLHRPGRGRADLCGSEFQHRDRLGRRVRKCSVGDGGRTGYGDRHGDGT